MKRTELLTLANSQVCGNRVEDYGVPENNFETIAGFWNVYLLNKFKDNKDMLHIEPVDVALMMSLLKTARLMKTPNHRDSWADGAGYFACGAEVSNA